VTLVFCGHGDSVTVATDAQAAQPTDDRPITHVFQNLGKDLRALGSLETGAVLIIGGGSAVLAHQRDASIAAWVQRQPAASYPGVGNTIGNEFTQAGGALAVWTLGTAAGSDELAHVGSDLIRAQVLDGLLTTAIKLAVDRRRPDGGSYSFPSGHTSGTFARPPTPNRKML
jgi:hypothetical protein